MKILQITMFCALTAAAGCGLLDNEILFVGYGELSGRVTIDGQPAGGALLSVLDETETWRKAVSDEAGRFRFIAAAGRGRTLLAVWGSGYGVARTFDLAGDGRLDLGDVALEPVALVTGRVGGAGLDPREAEVTVEGTPLLTRPDGDGAFQLALPAGRWTLSAAASGRLAAQSAALPCQRGEVCDAGELVLAVDPGHTCEVSETLTERFQQGGGGLVDLLLVVDNSASMVGEQIQLAESFANFATLLRAGRVDYRLAVITTGMLSLGCPVCDELLTGSCMNETGESGALQDRLGHITWSGSDPVFDFLSDPGCAVVSAENSECFYDPAAERGLVLVGTNGCGYERGLEAMRRALSDEAVARFLRPAARLAVVVVSDEEDCGQVGDVSEHIPNAGGLLCAYAAAGIGPDGSSYHPDDPEQRPYALTPVEEYEAFLLGLKPLPSMVTFSAVVGLSDPADPLSTRIEFADSSPSADVLPACETPGCGGVQDCQAFPGTRYIALANMLGGAIETLCQLDFSGPLARVAGASTGYRDVFPLARPPVPPESIGVRLDDQIVVEGWSFDPARQAVVFEAAHLPPTFATVTISYLAACR